MTFDNQKKLALGKKDKSDKGQIDKRIKPFVDLINSKRDYYTTSSCSGRIGILTEGSKGQAKWIFKSHEPVKLEQIKGSLENQNNQKLWFRQESLILHVCCRDIKSAQKLLKTTQKAGFKRTGIIGIDKRVIVEVKSDETINTILYNNTSLMPQEYMKVMIKEANKKLKNNFKRIKKLEKEIKKITF